MAGAIVVGAGPGIGAAVARRVAREGLAVGVIARRETTIDTVLETLSDTDALGVTADVDDEAGLRTALDEIIDRFGVPELLVYNAALIRQDAIGELTAREQLDAWAVNVVGAITTVAHVAPRMAGAGGGSVILTGGMPDADPGVTSLSLGKAGVRTLTRLLDKAYGPGGLHVATVTVAGAVEPDGPFDPEEIAEHYWRLHQQPRGTWEREVLYAGRRERRGASRENGHRPAPADTSERGPVRLLLIPGSNRAGSTNVAVLNTVAQMSGRGVTAELLEGLDSMPLFNPDHDAPGAAVPPVVEMRARIGRADAVLISTPEYAGALPAALKNALEWTIGDGSLDGKPVAWINAAGPAAPTGGADAHDSLLKVLRYAGADVVREACAEIPVVRSLVDEDGAISDAHVREEIAAVLDRLIDHVARTR